MEAVYIVQDSLQPGGVKVTIKNTICWMSYRSPDMSRLISFVETDKIDRKGSRRLTTTADMAVQTDLWKSRRKQPLEQTLRHTRPLRVARRRRDHHADQTRPDWQTRDSTRRLPLNKVIRGRLHGARRPRRRNIYLGHGQHPSRLPYLCPSVGALNGRVKCDLLISVICPLTCLTSSTCRHCLVPYGMRFAKSWPGQGL